MPEGINPRHKRSCASLTGARCNCKPSYCAEVYVAADRKRIRRTFPTLAEARRWRSAAATGAATGSIRASAPTTLREAAEAFLDGIESGAIRTRTGDPYKPSVARSYEQALRLHVLPVLGGAKLGRVARRDVQRLADEMLERGADPSTIRNALKPLRVIYRRAMQDGDVAASPCDGLRLPAVRGRRDRIADPEEAGNLLAALRPDDRALWATAFYAGLRLGELRALDWQHVDFANGLIRVERAMDATGVMIEPKSRAGRRAVPMIAQLRGLLEQHREATRGTGLVFGVTPHRAPAPNVLNRRAHAAWDRAGLERIGLHEARHTYASLLIAAGVNAKAISVYMGHSSIQVTFDLYGHLMPGNEAEAASMLEAYLARADTRSRLHAVAGATVPRDSRRDSPYPNEADSGGLEPIPSGGQNCPISGENGSTTPEATSGVEPLYTALQAAA